MAKSKFRENLLSLACTKCKRINYHTRKNKKLVTKKLEYQKFCDWCKKHTLHKEAKKL